MRPLLPLLLLALALPVSAGGFTDLGGKPIDEFTFSLRARAWASNQSGEVQDSRDGQDGSNVDFFADTDLDRHVYMPWGDAELRFKELALRFNAWGTTDTVRGEFKDDEAFAGHVFLQGDKALTRFSGVQGAFHFEWIPFDFGSEKKIGFEIGFLIGARVTRMEAFVRDSASGDRFRSSTIGGAPDLGLTLSLGFLNCVQIEAWVAGMQFRLGTYDYRAIDAGIEGRVYVDDHFYFGIGYHFNYTAIERGDARDNGNLLQMKYDGPSIMIGIQI
ncbi:MAG: hypothetical protein K8T20_04725 [Planctomycetes bacterium]|nr:hypothetical protein [Planctomycetota bacterium]